MATKNLTIHHHVNAANAFVNSFTTDNYYLFLADHSNHTNTTIANTDDSILTSHYDAWNDMILGKLITSSDVMPAIRYIPYHSNRLYDMYDDTDISLIDKDFYGQ